MEEKGIAIITGASTGLGRASSLLLKENGIIVYAGSRNIEKDSELKDKGIIVKNLDVTNDKSVKDFVDFVYQKEKRIDILLNNAGFGIFGPVETISMDDAKKQLDVNLFGAARVAKYVIPYMREQNSGLIINVTSMVGKMSLLLGDWYVASKFALEGLSDCMRMDLVPFNIKVVKLEPGMIYTPWYEKMPPMFLENTKNTPYEQEAKKSCEWLVGNAKVSNTKMSDVAKAVLKIVNTKHPKASYIVGKEAEELLAIKTEHGEEEYEKEVRKRILHYKG